MTSITWLILFTQLLAGCAGMTEGEKGAAIGAGVGAVVGAGIGAVVDPKHREQGAVIGGVVGSLLGGTAGWVIGEHHMRQVQAREQAAAKKRYSPTQGVLINIDRTTVIPWQLSPGDRLTFQVQYTALAPTQSNEVRARETRTLFFGDQVLKELSQQEVALAQGTSEFTFPLRIPGDAAQGNYTILTRVEPLNAPNPTKQEARSSFIVVTALAVPAVQPAMRPSAR